MADGRGIVAHAAIWGDQVSGASLPVVFTGDALCKAGAALSDDWCHKPWDYDSDRGDICLEDSF